MYITYLKIAFRHLAKYKVNSTVNIVGLSLALTSLLLIALWVQDELTYDHYHENADRLYKLNSRIFTSGNEWNVEVTPTAWGPTLADNYPQVEMAARISNKQDMSIGINSDYIIEPNFVWADSTIFDMFAIPFAAGNAKGALSLPYTMVLTREVAERRFGSVAAAVGQVVDIDEGEDAYKITAVVDNLPGNSVLNVSGFVSMATLYDERHPRPRPYDFVSHYDNTFLLAASGTRSDEIQALLPRFIEEYLPESARARARYEPELIKLTDLHLHSTVEELIPLGDINQIRLFAAVGIIILIIALANFVNLTMAHLVRRIRDLNLRRILGASRKHLILEIMAQASLIGLGAILLALALVELFLGQLNAISGKQLVLSGADYIWLSGLTIVALLLVTLSSIIPVVLVASHRSNQTLSGRQFASHKSSGVRGTLVTFQFAASIALLLATLTVFRQTNYLRTTDIGFEPERLITFETTQDIRASLPAFLEDIRSTPQVSSATAAFVLPSFVTVARQYNLPDTPDERMLLTTYYIDEQFIPTLGLRLLEGRNFSADRPTDTSDAFVVNESFLRMKGWETAEGHWLVYHGGDHNESGPIIGVVQDFNQTNMGNAIEPCVLQMEPDTRFYNVVARFPDSERANAISVIGDAWNDFEKRRTFTYQFYDDVIADLYKPQQRLGQMVLGFSALAIVIAGLGMFGLVSYKTEQAKKEISLRRVLGASLGDVATLLFKEFTRTMVIAVLIGLPVAHIVMMRWLEGFARRVDITIWSHAVAVIAIFAVVLITVIARIALVARTNPAEVLRYE